MAQIKVISCPECDASIRLSVRNNGEVTVLGSEKADPLENLKGL